MSVDPVTGEILDDELADGVEGDVDVALPVRRYTAVAAASRKAPLVGADKVNAVKVSAKLVRLAEAVVERGPLVPYLESLLPAQERRPRGGRTRVLQVRALVVALLLLALTEQAMIVRDAVALLNGLHPSTKYRLGIPRTVTERMFSRLFNQIAHAVDPSPHSPHNAQARRDAHNEIRVAHPGPENKDLRRQLHEAVREAHATELLERLARLRYVLDRGLDTTLPDEPHTGSYAIDSSEVASWAHQFHRQPKLPAHISDPDARWNAKGSGWFGYWLHGVVRVGEVGGPDTPCLVERIELTAANADIRVAGLDVLTRMVADHERADTAADRPHRPRRDVLADRAYTSEVGRADDWIWPLFALGFDNVHALTEDQVGQGRRPLTNGAIVVDGQPYSPRLPQHLRDLTPPKIGSPRSAITAYQEQVALRAPYALHAVGGRRDDGSWDFGCRAMSLLGSLRCDLKPQSMLKPPTVRRPTTDPTVFTPRRKPAICGQQKSRVQMTELPFWQPTAHGSAQWWDSFNRRNRIEGIFGNVKNDAAQNVTRGRFRVMGLAKVSLMTLFIVMAANLRLTQTFQARQEKAAAGAAREAAGHVRQRRQPRFHNRLRTEMSARIAAEKELAAIGDARAAGPPGP
ncbi:hypothetical protein ACI799_06010 [Blastococcus sp. SYSU DS0753]